ncbi:MAG TPA: SLBB domain-containing protein [Candidatus Dormibacteraeota bacterium]|nr:SLBB domain-containing protein [Candidatus Dormibacteraeota bacterium]
MNYRQILTIIGTLAAAAGAVASPASGYPAAPPTDYRFAPGDVIEVTVAPQQKYDRTLTVQPDGKISYPDVGELRVAGLTVAQLGEKLRQGLNRVLVDPVVTVSLREAGRREVGRISLLGAVRTQGGIDLKEGMTLAEALAAGGGPTPEADLRHVTISRADGSVRTVDLASAETTGRVDRTVVLQPGDIVVVPEGPPSTVLVLGAVAKPGPYPLPREARLLDAIGQAGGMTEKADLRRVMLARSGVPGGQTLDLQPLASGVQVFGYSGVQAGKGGPVVDFAGPEHLNTWTPEHLNTLNVKLQPGDTIFVAETVRQISVVGNVSKPDLYPLKPNERVLDALVAAGGAGGGAGKVYLVRPSGAGPPVRKILDLKKIMAQGDQAQNELLLPGDMLFVPDKKSPPSAGLLNLLWPLTSIFTLLR